jgi:hypothetical protein
MNVIKNTSLIILVFLNYSILLFAQQSRELYTAVEYPALPAKYCDMDEEMKESSGIIFHEGFIWTINDSGGEPEIYKIDKTTGEVSQKITLFNVTNIDWEDITQDEKFVYAGDFGNNDGDRKDLKIYKIEKSKITGKKKVEVNAEIIGFTFKDQKTFEATKRHHNFDCESLISFRDSLIVFSKNWEDGKTRMYKMPKKPGQYSLDPVTTFDADGLVTGADYNESLNKLVLIGYKDHMPFIFLVSEFDGKTFQGKEIYRFNLFKLKDSQAEGIAWSTGETVLFSTEQTKTFTQQVFELDFGKVFKIMGR